MSEAEIFLAQYVIAVRKLLELHVQVQVHLERHALRAHSDQFKLVWEMTGAAALVLAHADEESEVQK